VVSHEVAGEPAHLHAVPGLQLVPAALERQAWRFL
jgi:hypothetical protein